MDRHSTMPHNLMEIEMLRSTQSVVAILLAMSVQQIVSAHCQVPCGVYDDQSRFQAMLEDTKTITKAIGEIEKLASQSDALSQNQLARWVMTKEEHASHIQKLIAEYFMTQRIKPDHERYIQQLTSGHAVLLGAMKCKQTVDAKNAKALHDAILDLYRAYEGKEPVIE